MKDVMGTFLRLHKREMGKLGYKNKNKLLEILLRDMLDHIDLTGRWLDFSLGILHSRPSPTTGVLRNLALEMQFLSACFS